MTRAFEDYRSKLFTRIFRALKGAKSHLTCKLAQRVKRYARALAANPNNANARKCADKFGRKLAELRPIDSAALRRAAFLFCKFDLEIAVEKLGARAAALVGEDPNALSERVYALLADADAPRPNFLVFYESVKRKAPKEFERELEAARALVAAIRTRKNQKKIKKKVKIERKKTNENSEIRENVKQIKETKNIKQIKETENAKQIKETKNVKPIKEIKNVKPIKEIKNVKPIKEIKNVKQTQISAPKTDFHPSYLAKRALRESQSETRFRGEIVELE